MTIRNDLIYKDECYKIVGLIFEIFNNIGYGHKENFYQNAIANTFVENKIPFKQQLKARVKYKEKEIGYYFFDFLVFDKIVVELKQKNYFSKKDIDQTYSYLKAANLKLGILIYFTKNGIRYKRIVNLK
ncbi:MAG: GxxExxY protein [Candidatus Moranbacteria bacterium CG_4_9_14_3_um_filter_40_7]|nr:MAG: GxxExxY protein [Candidatus Moranbacteria bacterium CG23_combo_of_CG06-09_8_20_14_all_40_16]PIU80938.1 MAG: GxxExxY protein [Candidatus Moranbacteria bacterium CG06_land_8_20_14_3_00_40_12]PJA87524.1 MAG: GxxExxY protein [Candidatus Moranbacteria bacterium CG_4_9_14_3_um_filter_40_7]